VRLKGLELHIQFFIYQRITNPKTLAGTNKPLCNFTILRRNTTRVRA